MAIMIYGHGSDDVGNFGFVPKLPYVSPYWRQNVCSRLTLFRKGAEGTPAKRVSLSSEQVIMAAADLQSVQLELPPRRHNLKVMSRQRLCMRPRWTAVTGALQP
jgi:hypothetical protein